MLYLQIMKTLLEHGARTDVKDQEERTPLHLAAMYVNTNTYVFHEPVWFENGSFLMLRV